MLCAVFAHGLRVLDAAFGADDLGHLVYGGDVEGGGQPDRLRKLRCAVIDNAVQRFAPPVVGRNIEARNGARLVDELAEAFSSSVMR